MENPDAVMRVEVVYALPDRQWQVECQLPLTATVGDAIRASGLLAQFPQLNPGGSRLGIFGRLATLDTPLRAGDRVEIYRPLQADPKEGRRRRAASAGRAAG